MTDLGELTRSEIRLVRRVARLFRGERAGLLRHRSASAALRLIDRRGRLIGELMELDLQRRSLAPTGASELDATMTSFAGWRMPLRYTSETAEHQAVRQAAGLFDLSHMGEISVTGPGAGAVPPRRRNGSAGRAVVRDRARHAAEAGVEGHLLGAAGRGLAALGAPGASAAAGR